MFPSKFSFRSVVLAASLLLAPVAASACTPPPPGTPDLPVTLYSDGSFTHAETPEDFSSFSGRPVRDIGGGRVGQVLQYSACDTAQWLLFVDCTTGSAIMVAGIYDEEEAARGIPMSTTALQATQGGPLGLTAATTVADIQALALRERLTVETDVLGYAAERGPQNAFNPFYGCRIFYPGSVGAGR
jgi:hypothetical protein